MRPACWSSTTPATAKRAPTPPRSRRSTSGRAAKWTTESWRSAAAGRTLRLAARRTEHVACAQGAPVLAAGEIRFTRADVLPQVLEITNQSTGYCPEPESWPAVAAALSAIGLAAPDG